MAAFSHFSKNLLLKTLIVDIRTHLSNNKQLQIRLISYSSKEYDEKSNPAPIFLKPEVQSILKTLTRVDLAKVFRRKKLGDRHLEQPVYKFMTDKQLEQSLADIKVKVDELLQIPPVVQVRKPINRVLSQDPALQGLETSRLVFTDITFGVSDSNRIIVVREPDGALQEAEWELRDRINQIYFPVKNRAVKIPKMFLEGDHFNSVLDRKEYLFMLDRACLQFEPSDPNFHRVVSITYQHVNDNNAFEQLRSTRHFGGLVFFLAWHKMIDNLLLELLETSKVDEINALVELYCQIHKVRVSGDGNLKSVEEFIQKHANKKAALELALQAHKDAVRRQEQLDKGIQRAHGVS